MNNESEVRVCKNKKCQKVLPDSYQYNYCEACRNKQADKVKSVGKKVLSGVVIVTSVVATVLTAGKLNLKK